MFLSLSSLGKQFLLKWKINLVHKSTELRVFVLISVTHFKFQEHTIFMTQQKCWLKYYLLTPCVCLHEIHHDFKLGLLSTKNFYPLFLD